VHANEQFQGKGRRFWLNDTDEPVTNDVRMQVGLWMCLAFGLEVAGVQVRRNECASVGAHNLKPRKVGFI